MVGCYEVVCRLRIFRSVVFGFVACCCVHVFCFVFVLCVCVCLFRLVFVLVRCMCRVLLLLDC